MLKWFSRFIERILAVIGAFICIQFPLFIQQYIQQLNARVEELYLIVTLYKNNAMLSNKTIPQLIQKFLNSGDEDFVREGIVMQDLFNRWQQLSESLLSLQESSVWTEPFLFLFTFNKEIFDSTYKTFKWGITFSLEGFIFALIGIAISMSLFYLCKKIISLRPKS